MIALCVYPSVERTLTHLAIGYMHSLEGAGGSITDWAKAIVAGAIRAHDLPTSLVWTKRWTEGCTRSSDEMFELVVFSGFEVTERAPYLEQTRAWIGEATWKALDRASVEVLVGTRVQVSDPRE
jgi:hypothetical protein